MFSPGCVVWVCPYLIIFFLTFLSFLFAEIEFHWFAMFLWYVFGFNLSSLLLLFYICCWWKWMSLLYFLLCPLIDSLDPCVIWNPYNWFAYLMSKWAFWMSCNSSILGHWSRNEFKMLGESLIIKVNLLFDETVNWTAM